MFALSIQNIFCFNQTFEKNKNRYKDITKNYSESEIETIVKIFAEITNALEANPFQDFLGDLYMQLDMGKFEPDINTIIAVSDLFKISIDKLLK